MRVIPTPYCIADFFNGTIPRHRLYSFVRPHELFRPAVLARRPQTRKGDESRGLLPPDMHAAAPPCHIMNIVQKAPQTPPPMRPTWQRSHNGPRALHRHRWSSGNISICIFLLFLWPGVIVSPPPGDWGYRSFGNVLLLLPLMQPICIMHYGFSCFVYGLWVI
jgi:hypothetical protein